MVETVLKVVRVFIGSPGGLEGERQAAKRIVDEINNNHSEHWGCQIKLIGWEATLPGYSRAQSLINQDLDKCDYFVGVLWDHWGSKPDGGSGKYSSGFEEEFERASERIEKGFMKDIALYFKTVAEAQLKDPGASLKQVLAFREKCIKARKLLFKEFKEDSDFEPIFRAKIEEIGWREYGRLNVPTKEVADPQQPATEEKRTPDTPDPSRTLFGPSSATFVTEMMQRPADWDTTTPFEIARLRLIVLGASRIGNDETHLGNHDANLLFSVRNEYAFDEPEYQTLVDAGIVGFQHQNVPLWTWIASLGQSGDYFARVRMLAYLGTAAEKPNAIRILQCAGQSTPEIDQLFDKAEIVRSWLIDLSDKVFDAGLEFLNTNGDADDLRIVSGLISDVSEKRKNALAATIVALWVRIDLSKAFEALIELNPDTIGEARANDLFQNPEVVSTAVAVRCLKLKSENVRGRAALILHARQAIDAATALELLADPDFGVRLVAVETLIRQGTDLQEEAIKGALIKHRRSGGLFGLGYYGGTTDPDDTYYQRYRRNRLAQLGQEDLRKKADACDVFDQLELMALYSDYTGKCLLEIRTNLADRFKNYFDTKLTLTAALYQYDAKKLGEVQKLENYLRNALTSKTLAILCGYAKGADLDLVRATLDGGDVEPSNHVFYFLGRFGDWNDTPRILTFFQRRPTSGSLLSISSDEWAAPTARALYAIGKLRLVDLLQLQIDNNVRRALVMQFSKKDIRKLSDDFIVEQLNNSDDQFRKALAIKCALSLTQARSRKLLHKYSNPERQRYYNCIHWLDLGVSMARRIVKSVGEFELARFH